jgi:hypothetical protein
MRASGAAWAASAAIARTCSVPSAITVAPSASARRSSAGVLSGPLKTSCEPGTPARRATRYSKPDATSAQQPAR